MSGDWLERISGASPQLRARLAALYQGRCFVMEAQAESAALGALARELLSASFEHAVEALPYVHLSFGPGELYDRLSRARSQALRAAQVQQAQQALLVALGFGEVLDEVAFDGLRLRAISPGGHLNPAALEAYGAHRDTWYANPACQVNLWQPLFALPLAHSFAFYPEVFAQAVDNSSWGFDFEAFERSVGFQGQASGEAAPRVSFPKATGQVGAWGACQRFSMAQDEVLAFSAAHLHQSMPNETALTRFSVDMRLVWRRHQRAGLGAPLVDNGALGDASSRYLGAAL